MPDGSPVPAFVSVFDDPVELPVELPVEPPELVVDDVVVPLEEEGLVGVPGVVVGGVVIRWLSGPPVTVVVWTVGVVVVVVVAEPEPELDPPPPVLGGAVVTGIRGAPVCVVVVVVVVVLGGVELWPDEPPPETGLPVVVWIGDRVWLSGDETVVVVVVVVCCGLWSCVVSTCFFVVEPVESPEVVGALCVGALCVGAGAEGCDCGCVDCWSAGAVTGACVSVAVVPPSTTAGEPDGANGTPAESGGTRWPARRPAGRFDGAPLCSPATGDSAGPPAPAPTDAGAGEGVLGVA